MFIEKRWNIIQPMKDHKPDGPLQGRLVADLLRPESLKENYRMARAIEGPAYRDCPVYGEYPRPKEVFHYTSFEGAKGILETGCFWGSHTSHLNDAEELRYGIGLAQKELESLWKPRRNSRILNETISLLLDLSNSIDQFDFYVASFCEERDYSYQWKEYGKDGTGFALGISPMEFSLDSVNILGSELGAPEIGFDRIFYDQNIIERIINWNVNMFLNQKILPYIIQLIESKYPCEEYGIEFTYIDNKARVFIEQIWKNSCLFKRKFYCDEKEWRMYYLSNRVDNVEIKSNQIRNYVEFFPEVKSSVSATGSRVANRINRQHFSFNSVICGSKTSAEHRGIIECLAKKAGCSNFTNSAVP